MPQDKQISKTEKYTVLVSFTDREDNGTIYWAGKDKYPRDGYTPPPERIARLQSKRNALGKPVISSEETEQ